MLIAVLVLALLGLWSLPLEALLLAAILERPGHDDEPGGAGPTYRYACTVCGAHEYNRLPEATGNEQPEIRRRASHS